MFDLARSACAAVTNKSAERFLFRRFGGVTALAVASA